MLSFAMLYRVKNVRIVLTKADDALAGLVYKPEHRFEKRVVVPGIRNRLLIFQQQLYLLAVSFRPRFADYVTVIIQVHDEDPVEPVEIVG